LRIYNQDNYFSYLTYSTIGVKYLYATKLKSLTPGAVLLVYFFEGYS